MACKTMTMKHINNTKLRFAFLFCVALATRTAHAQNSVGIGTANPSPKAVLDLQSGSQGFLMPRISTAQRIAINPTAGDDGLLLYDNTLHTFLYWNGSGSAWQPLGAGGAAARGVWQAGAGVPDNSSGQEGDFYLDTATKELYRKNASGVYNSIAVFGEQFWQSVGPTKTHTSRNVGIGMSNPVRALEVVGGIVSSHLAGGGFRLLLTDNTGEISALGAVSQPGFLRNDGLGNLSWQNLGTLEYNAGLGIAIDNTNRIISNTGDQNADDDILVGSAAGGDLEGTYPDPAIKTNAVTTAKIADAAVTTDKIADGSVNAGKITPGPPNTQLTTDNSGTVTWVASGTAPLQTGEIAVGAGGGVSNNVVPYQDIELQVDGRTIVRQLQGNPVDAQYPSAGQTLTWNGTFWVAQDLPPAAAPVLEAGKIFIGDASNAPTAQTLSQDMALAADGSATVQGLQGRPVGAAAPTASQVLTWNGASSQWEAQNPASALPAAASANQVLTWDGSAWVAANVPAQVLDNGHIWVGDGSNAPAAKEMRDLATNLANEIIVSGLQKNPIDNAVLTSSDADKVLTWNGSEWTAQPLPVVAAAALDNGKVFIGDASGVATGQVVSRDVTIANTGEATVTGLYGKDLAANTGTIGTADAGKILTWNGSAWEAQNSPAVTAMPGGLNNGDLLRYDEIANAWVRMGRGSSNQVLTSTATDIQWQTPAAAADPWTETTSTVTLTNAAKNVGIGVANPTEKLQVAGKMEAEVVGASNFLTFGTYGTSTANAGTLRWNGSNYVGRNATQDLVFLATPTFGTAGQILTSTGTGAQWQTPASAGASIWQETASEVKLLDGTKKVGIGVTLSSPLSYQLEVDGITRTNGLYANYARLFGPLPGAPSIPGTMSFDATSGKFIGYESTQNRTFITVPTAATPTDGQVPTFDGPTSNVVWRSPATGGTLSNGTANNQVPLWNTTLTAWVPTSSLDATTNGSGQIINIGLQGKPLASALQTINSTTDVNKVLTWNGTAWVAQTPLASITPTLALESQTYTIEQTRYYSIDPTDFVCLDDKKLVYGSDGEWVQPDDEATIAAPVHLPAGAVVTSVDFIYLDNQPGSGNDMDFSVLSTANGSAATIIGVASSTGAVNSARTTSIPSLSHTVSADRSYKVAVGMKDHPTHRLYRVKVTYTVTKPD